MFTIFLYRLLFLPVFILCLPYYAFHMWKRGGYANDFKFRFGMFAKLSKRKFGKRRLWIQAVSIGEVKAIGKLIDLFSDSGSYQIVLSTTASTSYELARKLYGQKTLFIGLFPFDFWPFSHLAWNKIFPHVAVLVESEIWPKHIWQASTRDVPVVLVNARISDRAFPRYKYLKNLAAPILDKVSCVLAADELSADCCREMGISSHRIKIAGNLKFDNDVKKLSKDEELALRHSLGFGESDPILLGSSTWPGEEEVLLRALRKCQNIDKRWKLLLVPRHAERRDRIVAILQASKFKWHRKSNGDSAEGVDVCLADTTGELQTLTSLCTLAFIGKSLEPNGGGQSPLDAACCGIPMVYGNRMTNFRDICSSLEQGKCVVKVRDAATAVSAIATLARDGDRRKVFAKSLMEWHRNNCGASKFVFQKICEIAFAKK